MRAMFGCSDMAPPRSRPPWIRAVSTGAASPGSPCDAPPIAPVWRTQPVGARVPDAPESGVEVLGRLRVGGGVPELGDPAVHQPAGLDVHDVEVPVATVGGDADRGAAVVVVGEQGQWLHLEAALGELHDLAEELEERGPPLVGAGQGGPPGHVPPHVLGHQLLEYGEVSLREGLVALPHAGDVRVLGHGASSESAPVDPRSVDPPAPTRYPC